MVKYIVGIVCLLILIYVLSIFKRNKLNFWYYLTGSIGVFLLMMFFLKPVLTLPLARAVAALAGLVGELTGLFTAYFKYGIIFVESKFGAMTLQIDFECSGIIEILAYLSLLLFYNVYDRVERFLYAIVGILYVIAANAIRIVVICWVIHTHGPSSYFIAHTIVGRIVFYVLSVMLYFYVFTKSQVLRMRLGSFTYGHKDKTN